MIDDKQKILIVDDQPENLFALDRSLSRNLKNIEIITALSGNEALKALLINKFAMVILDINMPEMDGYELAEIIRSKDKFQKMPLLFLSAINADDFQKFNGYDAETVDFMTKPVDLPTLLSKINSYLKLL